MRNEAKYLRACIDSIRQQSFHDWELIVIDDHSEDKTVKILEEYAAIDPRITWYPNKGKGILPALHQAFELSAGEFITRMDGDDLMPSYKLEKLFDLLKDAPLRTIATGKVNYFGETEVSEGYRRYEEWINERCERNDHWNWVYRECVIASPNWLCRRKDLIDIGAFDQLIYPEDYDLVLKWHQYGFNVNCSEEITHLWREHPERTSRNSPVYDQRSFFRLKIPYLVNQFTAVDFLILGAGQKARLCANELRDLGRSYLLFDELDDPTIESHVDRIPECGGVLLLAIFPSEPERIELEGFIRKRGYQLGKDAFYV